MVTIPGNTVVFNSLGTSSTQVIGEDSNRREITFHNPNGVSVVVCQALDSSGSALTASFSTLGGMHMILAGADSPTFKDNVGCAWNAAAQSGSTNGLTMTIRRG